MKQAATALATLALAAAIFASPAAAAPEDFGLESVEAALSTTQAGAHPDLTFSFDLKRDPASEAKFGLQDSYALTRNVRFDLPPGLTGDPNVFGVSQQCTVAELSSWNVDAGKGGGCPNASQVGLSRVFVYGRQPLVEPVFMMAPPGGDVVARFGFIAGAIATFADVRVRSESDYGLVVDIADILPAARLLRAETTTWGVPADPSHDTQRCTPFEVLLAGCVASPSRPPGSSPLPFMTNPTRCGVPLEMRVSASSWNFPDDFDTMAASFPQISGCNSLPFGPGLTVEPTNRIAGAPTGLDLTLRLPAADGVNVLEPSQVKDIRIDLPEGLAINTASADGLETCSVEQVRFGRRENAQCPDAAKLGETEFDIPALPRKMKGAIYIREPVPGNLFRIWVVADDQGAHVKLPGQLVVDEATGQIDSIVLDIPQFPVREVKLVLKSGFRAPLVNPPTCGTYFTAYEFTPWSGNPSVKGRTPMTIDEGCDTGGFDPKLSAGTTDPSAGQHAPFLFTLTRQDGEQIPATLDIALPQGLAATLAGVPRCESSAAQVGACPPDSRIGKVIAAAGAGPAPLWVPQPGKRPTAVYLGGPYKGAPLSAIAVVPAQAGPFDLGDVVVRNAIYVDPVTAQATVRSDPLPQIIEGIPIRLRTAQVQLDRPSFTFNPTDCSKKQIEATVTSTQGAVAKPTSPFRAADCANLPFKPSLTFRLRGPTGRGGHPALRAVLKARPGDANIGAISAALPHSEFLDQAHIGTVCTRVQFAANQCPSASVYGHVVARTPILNQPLSGPVYLRSSSNPLPDAVARLQGEIEIEVAGRVDSVNGGIRTSFEAIPDAPITSAVLTMQGGKKGLFVNSTDICAKTYRATVKFRGQNGRKLNLRPKMRADCGKHRKKR